MINYGIELKEKIKDFINSIDIDEIDLSLKYNELKNHSLADRFEFLKDIYVNNICLSKSQTFLVDGSNSILLFILNLLY